MKYVIYSPDGKYLFARTFDKKIICWSTDTWKLLWEIQDTFKLDDFPYLLIGTISFDQSGKHFISAFADSSINIWDTQTGKFILKLKDKVDLPRTIELSNDGNHVLASSYSGTVLVWDINNPINTMQDISDSVFSIVSPVAKAKDIDLGKVYLGHKKYFYINNYLKNAGEYPVRIDTCYISGTNASQFDIVNKRYPFSIAVNESINMEFAFAPRTTGIISANVFIITQCDTLLYTIQGEGVEPQLEIISDLINFGNVNVGENKIISKHILKNISNSVIDFNSIDLLGPDTVQFKINGNSNITLQPGDSVSFDVEFSPTEIGRTSSVARLQYAGNIYPSKIYLFGNGITPVNVDEQLDENLIANSDELFIYPNPSKDFIEVKVNLEDEFIIDAAIQDLNGQVVKNIQKEKYSKELKLDTSSLPSGTYILILQTPTLTLSKKFIISR